MVKRVVESDNFKKIFRKLDESIMDKSEKLLKIRRLENL